MKQFLFLCIFGMTVLYASGNIAPPQAYLSEITADSQGYWSVEIGFYSYYNQEIDSIRLVTTSGSALITSYTLLPGTGSPGFDSLAVITQQNLANTIALNPDGDFVKLISYNSWGLICVDSVAFGDYPGSYLDCIVPGESVSFILYDQGSAITGGFGIDMSPTMGSQNDTTGALNTMTGRVYDPEGNLFSAGFFPLPGIINTNIQIQPDGSYSQRVLCRRYQFDMISIYNPPWPYTIKTYTTEPVSFCMSPGNAIEQDILTLTDITGIGQPGQDQGYVIVPSPNPFTSEITFFLNLKNCSPDGNAMLSVSDAAGRVVLQAALSPSQSSYQWKPGKQVSPGIMFYQLSKGGQVLRTGKLIKL